MTRREAIASFAGSALAPRALNAGYDSRVAIAKCRSYGAPARIALARMFDQLGGLGRLVQGRTVAVKINLTGSSSWRLGHAPLGEAQWVHPDIVGSLVSLLGDAGARRIRIIESAWNSAEPLEEAMIEAGWEPLDFTRAASRVEFENTNLAGPSGRYTRFAVPRGGFIYPGFDLNSSYADCDVFVSLAKLKEHGSAGITLSMKNLFGIAPCTIYGDGAGADEPSRYPKGGRAMFHSAHRQPPKSAPQPRDTAGRDQGYRVPRIVADLCASRPIHLAVIDGIETMSGAEGPWIGRQLARVSPGLLVAGLNPVSTDAVCAALMGFDPMASRGTYPFTRCDNTLELGEQAGLGVRDLRQIELPGTRLADAVFPFPRAASR